MKSIDLTVWLSDDRIRGQSSKEQVTIEKMDEAVMTYKQITYPFSQNQFRNSGFYFI